MQQLKPVLTAAALLVCLGFSAAASAGPPTRFLQSVDNDLKPLLADAKRNERKIVQIVGRLLDFDRLCKDSLGKHWEGRTDAERKEFVTTLTDLIEKNLVTRMSDTKNHIVKYESEEAGAGKAAVTTIVASGPGPRDTQTEIVYKLEQRGNGWVVVDMVTDGVSLVQNYRSQFNKIITKDGWAVMIRKMKDKLAEK
ncbi:MAG TPA: ABC transporter substrate-binding protein [Polyangia bacterium]|nr:ABC transporter substrate-binding protein [Polyangia bacterium]